MLQGLITVNEAVRLLPPNWNSDKLRRELRAGRVQGWKLGRDWYLSEGEIERLRSDELPTSNEQESIGNGRQGQRYAPPLRGEVDDGHATAP